MMYDRITKEKIETEVGQVESVYMRLHLLKGLKSLDLVKDELAELRQGHIFTKYCYSRKKALPRKVYIDETESEIRWIDPANPKETPRGIKLA